MVVVYVYVWVELKKEGQFRYKHMNTELKRKESVLAILDAIIPYVVVWIKIRSFIMQSARTLTFKIKEGELVMETER